MATIYKLTLIMFMICIVSCDGGILIRGYTMQNMKVSGIVVDTTKTEDIQGKPVEGVKIRIYSRVKNSVLQTPSRYGKALPT